MLRDTRRSYKPECRARYPDVRPFVSECSLKVRRLLREQDQAGALPAALSISRDAKSRCRSGRHRPGCGGSTPPSCRGRVASIAAMQPSLKPQRCLRTAFKAAPWRPTISEEERGLKNSMRSLACPARRITLLPSASSSVAFQRFRSSITRARRFERRR